MGALNKMLMV